MVEIGCTRTLDTYIYIEDSILEWAERKCMYMLLSSKLYEGETNQSHTWQEILVGKQQD